MTFWEAIFVIVSFIVLYLMTRGHNQSASQSTPKLPYNDSKYKLNSGCRFWGHEWSKWRNSMRGSMNYQVRECENCGRVEQRINPYIG